MSSSFSFAIPFVGNRWPWSPFSISVYPLHPAPSNSILPISHLVHPSTLLTGDLCFFFPSPAPPIHALPRPPSFSLKHDHTSGVYFVPLLSLHSSSLLFFFSFPRFLAYHGVSLPTSFLAYSSLLLVIFLDLSSLGPNILTHTPTLAWLRLYRPLLWFPCMGQLNHPRMRR